MKYYYQELDPESELDSFETLRTGSLAVCESFAARRATKLAGVFGRRNGLMRFCNERRLETRGVPDYRQLRVVRTWEDSTRRVWARVLC